VPGTAIGDITAIPEMKTHRGSCLIDGRDDTVTYRPEADAIVLPLGPKSGRPARPSTSRTPLTISKHISTYSACQACQARGIVRFSSSDSGPRDFTARDFTEWLAPKLVRHRNMCKLGWCVLPA
jgi:hypothetical protein